MDDRFNVESFAALCAALDHPFADPTRILMGAGLDVARYAELRRVWRARLAAGGEAGAALGARYAAAYRNALDDRRREPAAKPRPETMSMPAFVPGSEKTHLPFVARAGSSPAPRRAPCFSALPFGPKR